MRGFYTAFLTIAVLLLLPVSLYAQGFGFNSNYLEFAKSGGGARAAGMGGAYLGISEGEMAYSWNPAALISTDKTKFGAQLASVNDKFGSTYVYKSRYYTSPNIQGLDITRKHFGLNYAGLTVPFQFMEMNWAVGGGYRNVFDMVSEYSLPGFNGTTNSYSQDRGIDAVSGAIAAKIFSEIGIGMTINTLLRNSEYNYYEGAVYEYVSQNGIDTSLVDTWVNNNAHFSGVNLDLGVWADMGIVKGGLVIHTPYDLVQHAKQTYSIIIPPEPFGAINRVKVTYNMPVALSAGVAAIPIERLTVGVDFYMQNLSEVDAKYDYEIINITDTTISTQWKNISQFRVGAEYVFDAGFAEVPIRAGFRNEPASNKKLLRLDYDETDSTFVPTYENGSPTTNIISFGTGLKFDRVWFDLAYQFGSSSYDRTIAYPGISPSPVFEIKRDYSRFIISTGMYF